MKATELRIGNMVELNGEFLPAGLGVIESINAQENKLELHWGYNCKFKPIPLTEEWLLKFGWIWNERTKSFENTDTRMHLEYRKLNGSYTMFNYVLKAKIAERIWHVHQLQNLYFALTGTELTIKEKV
jgi:hypothetical protein